ncbi:acyl-CoA dehydrogenase family protein [Phenylobacterium sp.]|uniref:acyl-CoA dehydrogenase family protein n=1 Tax=Phenylobacterium sp. TaxID=1871053 RepID=UPI002BECFC63|nr:acyl-CoA dehydrogenase family protein [Phenylobacterium sp.]HVI31010.1 acyl-CoA dehydrogenase family protein [Phenylobacterium sp.]
MPNDPVEALVLRARTLSAEVLAPRAEQTDAEALWPAEQLQAIAAAGLLGLHVPRRLGGHGLGLAALARIAEELAVGCSSSAMCYAMHCVGTAVIAAKATPFQEQRYLAPIAQGRHITSLALSEPGTGANFYLPRTTFRRTGRGFALQGEKSFVTNGGHADSYVVSAVLRDEQIDPGTFTCLLVDSTAPGLDWGPPWAGFGMRGNSSRRMMLNGATLPPGNLLGTEGDQDWYVFEVVAPYFLVAMSGVYLGLAEAALRTAVSHLQARVHVHTGEPLMAQPLLVEQIADLWRLVARTRQFVAHAAGLWDAGAPGANAALFAAKVDVAEACVSAANSAMMLLGGRGYEEHGKAGRLLRDAQAAHVMGPTTHILKTWLGRTVLGLPPF